MFVASGKLDMKIDIISDVVCPWCFIGKRHLASALASYRAEQPDAEAPTIRWLAFQLNPQLPAEGMPRSEYTATKFGGADRAREIYARVAQAGRSAGIDFRFDAIEVQPNTIDAHRLVSLAHAAGVQDQVVESLFAGYFLEGRDLSQQETLIELAQRGGLEQSLAANCLGGDALRQEVIEQDNQARAMGVQGVPFFIFNRKLAVSGAQPPQVLLDAMLEAQASTTAAAES
jgi:predicted DsbA family dithiol-disulfide isomerase